MIGLSVQADFDKYCNKPMLFCRYDAKRLDNIFHLGLIFQVCFHLYEGFPPKKNHMRHTVSFLFIHCNTLSHLNT